MRSRAFQTVCLVLLVVTAAAQATTLRQLGEAEMVDQAGAIVLGRSVAAEYQRAGSAVVTLVRVEVGEALKGTPADQLTVVVPGGIDSSGPISVARVVPGAPVFFDQERVLLFLADSALVPGAYDVVGFNQGKFSIVAAPGGATLAVGQGRPMPLEHKKRQIRAHLAGGK